jgi:hypothetical protein
MTARRQVMRTVFSSTCRVGVLAILLVLAAPCASAQMMRLTPTQRAIAADLMKRSIEAFEQRDYSKAEDLLRRNLAIEPTSFVVLYNLACCRAMQGDRDGAGEFLTRAVENGFTDVRHLRRDEAFDGMREEAWYRRIVEGWRTLQLESLDANLRAQRAYFGKGYREWRDERLKVHCLTAFDARTDEQVRAELSLIGDWCAANVIPDLFDPAEMVDDAWVVIVLPTREDFTRWVTDRYGPDAVKSTSMVAGSYEHDEKRLVAMDLGATLRHEFLHVLHWRSITREGRAQPVWVMEGLCSLVEDYDVGESGRLIPSPSWRTNILKRLERSARLTPLRTLAGMNHREFTSGRVLSNYAHARGVFLMLAKDGRLREWYEHYTHNHGVDPSGIASLEAVLGVNGPELDARFRQFVRTLPSVPEEIRAGMASLGVEVEAGDGEGPLVVDVPRRADGTRVNLRRGDIITAIDGRPVRDMAELVRVLSLYKPGDEVEVAYRRYRLSGTVTVKLVRK